VIQTHCSRVVTGSTGRVISGADGGFVLSSGSGSNISSGSGMNAKVSNSVFGVSDAGHRGIGRKTMLEASVDFNQQTSADDIRGTNDGSRGSNAQGFLGHTESLSSSLFSTKSNKIGMMEQSEGVMDRIGHPSMLVGATL
jgi:hypothetical protein